MPRRKTHSEFIKDFYEKNSNAENIEILGEYKNNKTKIKCRCKIDNHIWEVVPSSLLQGIGCPKCGGSKGLTHNEFLEKFYEKNSNAENIEILGEYKNNKTKIKCRCKIDNHIWWVTPNHLLRDSGCPKCGNAIKKTHKQFIKELSEINSDIEVLEEYINAHTLIKCRCKIDNYIWEVKPNDLLSNKGCPQCANSKGEKAIAKYLKEHNIKNIPQYKFDDCKFYRELQFDFYIPTLNIAIEYDGKDHYEIFIRSNNETYEQAMDRFINRVIRDTIKTQYCKDYNIRLIRIPYWKFDNIEKILDEILK